MDINRSEFNTSEFTADELGRLEALLLELSNHRIPRLLQIKREMDSGKHLGEWDCKFLMECFELSRGSSEFADKHPTFKKLVAELAQLYKDITDEALTNESLPKL